MKPFEELLRREQYNTESRDNACKKRQADRRLTREERERRRYRSAHIAVVTVWALIIASLLTVPWLVSQSRGVDATKTAEPAETTTDTIVEANRQAQEHMLRESAMVSKKLQEQFRAEIEEQPEDFENEKIEAALLERAHKIEDVTITHYCSERYPHICGTGTGKTASGRWVQPYVSVAVDPKVIPLGSTVILDYGDGELHYYRADDTGAWVNGAHIDVAVTTHKEAESLGIKKATIYWCEEG